MTGIVWCNTLIEGIEQLEKIEEQYKIMNEIDLLDIIYKIDLVFIDDKTRPELLESIKRDGVEF